MGERRIFPWIFFCLLISGIAYLYVRDEVWFACSSEQRLRTPERAGAFARNYVINDRVFWRNRSVTSSAEIEQIVGQQPFRKLRPIIGEEDDPPAIKGDYFIQDDSRWYSRFSLTKKGDFFIFYELFFDDCGRNARSEMEALRETN